MDAYNIKICLIKPFLTLIKYGIGFLTDICKIFLVLNIYIHNNLSFFNHLIYLYLLTIVFLYSYFCQKTHILLQNVCHPLKSKQTENFCFWTKYWTRIKWLLSNDTTASNAMILDN